MGDLNNYKIDSFWNNPQELHISVLLHELVESINIFQDRQNIIVDWTLWMWWHATKIIERLNPWDIFIWFDADIRNLEIVKPYLESRSKDKNIHIFFVNKNFVHLKSTLEDLNISTITWIYFDLWLSSLHIDDKNRWFSFRFDGPLDMRFDANIGVKASEILNSYTSDRLFGIFTKYWEEPRSKAIVSEITKYKKTKNKFETTKDLLEVLDKVSKSNKLRARIFQALRIEVNKELDHLDVALKDAIDILDTDGNISIISFHSLEDRIVKNIFRDESRDCICSDIICTCHHKKKLKIVNKKPITPSEEELKLNPRSRSAKLRIRKKT